MRETTKKACEFMKKLLSNGSIDDKLFVLFAQTCKIEIAIQ
jgi:hypothetical protein